MIGIGSAHLSSTVPTGKCPAITRKTSLGREFWLGSWKGKVFIEHLLCAKKLLIRPHFISCWAAVIITDGRTKIQCHEEN